MFKHRPAVIAFLPLVAYAQSVPGQPASTADLAAARIAQQLSGKYFEMLDEQGRVVSVTYGPDGTFSLTRDFGRLQLGT